MKSKAGNFLLATGGYLLYLFSGVFSALILCVFEFVRTFFEKGSAGSFSDTFYQIMEKQYSLILLVSYVIVVAFVFSVLKLRRKNAGAYTGLSFVYPFGVFGAIILGAVLNFTIFSLVSSYDAGETEINALFMICVLLSPFVEELVFRGVLLRIFGRVSGALTAIFITSLLFAISHTDTVQMIYAFVLGIVLGIVRIRSGSLWNAVALHLSFNLSGIVLATSEVELPETAFLALPVLAILSFLLACSGRKQPARRK